jgi:hypothetical protein
MKPKIIECPRCGEGDERAIGRNTCGLCECLFLVTPSGRVADLSRRIGAATSPKPGDALSADFVGSLSTQRGG